MQRRKFIGNISKAGILGTLAATPMVGMARQIQQLTARPAEGHIFLAKPYLQNPAPDTIEPEEEKFASGEKFFIYW